MAIPLCFVWGCPTKISTDNSDTTPRICPRCHNPSVRAASSRQWFEFCFVPLIPCMSQDIWFCSICRWETYKNVQPQPQIAPQGYHGAQQGNVYKQPGYQQPPNPNAGWGGQQNQSGFPQNPYPPPQQQEHPPGQQQYPPAQQQYPSTQSGQGQQQGYNYGGPPSR